MKLIPTMKAASPKQEREFNNVIQRLTNGMASGDVLIITHDPETGRWGHSLTRKTVGEELEATLKRAIE